MGFLIGQESYREEEQLQLELGPFECECGASYAREVKNAGGILNWGQTIFPGNWSHHFVDECQHALCNKTVCHECGFQCNHHKETYCKDHADDYLKETGICEDCTLEEEGE